MNISLQIVISLLIIPAMFFIGYHGYVFLNNKIKESNTAFGLFIYTLALIAFCALIVFAGMFSMMSLFVFLK